MRHFDDWLRAYMEFTSDSESPDAFHFWTGVSTLAAVLRRRVWIDQRKFIWTPNFYSILVGPAGVAAKSTSMGSGIHLLEQVPGIKLGPESATARALIDVMAESVERVIYEDNGKEQELWMSPLTVPVSELGTFMEGTNRQMLSYLTDLWDGSIKKTPWKHRTNKDGATNIKKPWLNIIGCTTPTWLKNNFPEALLQEGFGSRVMFVYGDKKRKLVPYPALETPASQYEEFEQKLVEDLTEISQLIGPYELTKEAYDWGSEWYNRHWRDTVPKSMASDRYDGYRSRKQSHIHKLAIVMAASRRNERFITKDDLILAHELLLTVEPHMIKVFESIGLPAEASRISTIAHYIRAYGSLNEKELWALVVNVMEAKHFKEALAAGVQAGVFQVVTIKGARRLILSSIPPS